MLRDILEFINMGGYGVYIWPCYLLLICLLYMHIASALKHKKRIKIKIYNMLQSEFNNDSNA